MSNHSSYQQSNTHKRVRTTKNKRRLNANLVLRSTISVLIAILLAFSLLGMVPGAYADSETGQIPTIEEEIAATTDEPEADTGATDTGAAEVVDGQEESEDPLTSPEGEAESMSVDSDEPEVAPLGEVSTLDAPLSGESFQLKVTVGANQGFILPTGSYLNNNYNKTNYWNIDWGDNTQSNNVTVQQSGASGGVAKPANYSSAGTYTITITPAGSTEAWFSCFGFSDEAVGSNDHANKAKVTEVIGPLTPQMTRTARQISGSDAAPQNEWYQAFYSCTMLTRAPIFSGWEGVSQVGDNFSFQMFMGCAVLTALPDGFNFPQSITHAQNGFAYEMFYLCTSLTTLPEGFTFPQSLTSVGTHFAMSAFDSCYSLGALPASFNLPQNLTSVQQSFAAFLFNDTGGPDFQINDAFTFPSLISAQSSTTNSFFYALNLSPDTPIQERLASEIIGSCATPSSARYTFNAKFSDLFGIPVNWGGQGVTNYFQLEVTLTSAGSFAIPTSGMLGGDNEKGNKANTWNITWGDGKSSSGVQVVQLGSHTGVVHAYASAGTYTITITPAGSTEAWLSCFGFDLGGEGANDQANRDKVTRVMGPITPNMTRTTSEIAGTGKVEEWAYTFTACTKLTEGPRFVGWENVTSVNDSFAAYMYTSCLSLTTLPAGTSLPQNLTTAGNGLALGMFSRCSSLNTLPNGFNLPQNLTSVGANFASYMFQDCTSLTTLPASFNLPQNLTTVGISFANRMFIGAGSSSFQINDAFIFPSFNLAQISQTDMFYQTFKLSAQAPTQNRTATSIIGNCETPNTTRETFGDGININAQWSDQFIIHTNWGGLGLTDYFQFEVTLTSAGSFSIPTSSNLGGSTTDKTNYWNIHWGDNSTSTNVTVVQSSAQTGVEHVYAEPGSYLITITPAGTTDAWLSCFGFQVHEEQNANLQENKDKVTRVLGPITPNMTRMPNEILTFGKTYEWAYAFQKCTNLVEGPAMNGWDNVVFAHDYFVYQMFRDCTKLTTFSEDFTLPPSLIAAGSHFAENLFYNCTDLMNLPQGFNLPQSLTSAGEGFAKQMFFYCTSLVSLPDEFTLPQTLTAISNSFAYRMFYLAGGTSFQFNDAFVFPALNQSQVNTSQAFYQAFQLKPQAPLQNRTAASIIGECATPTDANHLTFGNSVDASAQWSDQIFIHNYWGGLALTDSFQFEVTLTSGGSFFLPTSSFLGGSSIDKTNNWHINWGDNSISRNVEVKQELDSKYVGIEHAYAEPGSYLITIVPAGTTEAWLSCFGFRAGSLGANSPENKQKVTKVFGPITPNMTRTNSEILAAGKPYEWANTFINCTNLIEGPVLSGWEDVVLAHNFFGYQMFRGCTSLTTMPEGFTLPQSLTSVGSSFAENLFNGCTALTTLPDSFNLPQVLTSAGDSFAGSMFFNCTSLTGLPDSFTLPSTIRTIGKNFASQMFLGAGSSSFQFNDAFEFPALSLSQVNREYSFYKAFQLSAQAPMQNRTATSIIGSCETPTSANHYTFGDSVNESAQWSDQPGIPLYWGGLYTTSLLTITLELDKSYSGVSDFLIEVTNSDTQSVFTKILSVPAGATTADFVLKLDAGSYTVEVQSYGSTWRYTPGAPQAIGIVANTEVDVTLDASLNSSQWLTDTGRVLNAMTDA